MPCYSPQLESMAAPCSPAMFLILISCNNSILPGRFYFTDKRLCVSPPAGPPAPSAICLSERLGDSLCSDSNQLRKTIVIPQLSALGITRGGSRRRSQPCAHCSRSPGVAVIYLF